ncbi:MULTISPECIES: hypothetical protein [Henriciella]|jgi:hypothetical protein|uniref:hypothetical protein n=1 Tax=Henriciella TaxID=453849 RepID=UPI003516D582
MQTQYLPELMSKTDEAALLGAVKEAFCSKLELVWRAAFERSRGGRTLIDWSDVQVRVLPLDRIGAPKGASGARIYVVYLIDNRADIKGDRLSNSSPLVVKLGAHAKLEIEMTVGEIWPRLDPSQEAHFAKPIDLVKYDDDTSVLLAPFRSNYSPGREPELSTVVLEDLWKRLHDECERQAANDVSNEAHWESCATYVEHCVETMHEVHKNHAFDLPRKRMHVSCALDRYFRKIGTNGVRRHLAERVFGTGPNVDYFGLSWINPIEVADELIKRNPELELAVGPVHGDLHPKNIVLGRQGTVNIIDFGWIHEEAPIVIDYLLLDINLRSITLPSQTSQQAITMFGSFLDRGMEVTSLSEAVRDRARIISEKLWDKYFENAKVENWDKEYLIPMFIVAFGLLVHMDEARNQTALLSTILALGNRLHDVVRHL